jgi:hypothetical protein
MKNFDRLAFYGWPVLAIIFIISLFAGLLFIPEIRQKKVGPSAKPAVVRYAATDKREPLSPGEMAEIRALYASDLFASSGNSGRLAPRSPANHFNQTNSIPSVSPLFLNYAPAPGEINQEVNADIKPGRSQEGYDLQFLRQTAKKTFPAKKEHAGFSVELQGSLHDLKLEKNFMKDIPAPPDKRPRSLQAQIRLNRQGYVERVLADSTDFEPAIYREILRNLYQARFGSVSRACEGTVIISYPAFSLADSNTPGNARQ